MDRFSKPDCIPGREWFSSQDAPSTALGPDL